MSVVRGNTEIPHSAGTYVGYCTASSAIQKNKTGSLVSFLFILNGTQSVLPPQPDLCLINVHLQVNDPNQGSSLEFIGCTQKSHFYLYGRILFCQLPIKYENLKKKYISGCTRMRLCIDGSYVLAYIIELIRRCWNAGMRMTSMPTCLLMTLDRTKSQPGYVYLEIALPWCHAQHTDWICA